MPLKQFLDFLELFLIKNKFEKTNLILLDWGEPEGPTLSGPPRPSRDPIWARRHRCQAQQAPPPAC
jgi:hypothetical protein